MARTSLHVYTKNEIKNNAKLIQNTFSRFGEKVKATHAHEVAAVLAGYKDWSTANALAEDNIRSLTVIIGAIGSGKTTYILNTVDLCNDTLIIDYGGEWQPFEDATVMPLKNKRDADLIIKILPLFKTVILDESNAVFEHYPELFANVLYCNVSTVITAQHKRTLESVGLSFNVEPKNLFTRPSQMITVYEFVNPHIGRKEFESLSPWQMLQANITHNQNVRENIIARRDLDIAKISHLLQDARFTTPLAIVGDPGTGKTWAIKIILQESNIYENFQELYVATVNVSDVIIAIKSEPTTAIGTLLYFDVNGSIDDKDVEEILNVAVKKEFGICFGFNSEEDFKRFNGGMKFFGVIRTNGKAVSYSDSVATTVFGNDFNQASDSGTGMNAMVRRMKELEAMVGVSLKRKVYFEHQK